MCEAIGDKVAPTFFGLFGLDDDDDDDDSEAKAKAAEEIENKDSDLIPAAEMAKPGSKLKRGSRKNSTILTSPRGVNASNKSQVKTLLGS